VETRLEELHCRPGAYLTFRVARQDFAMEARCVRGIVPAGEMQPLETAVTLPWLLPLGDWICGFAMHRGEGIPVIDLRAKFDWAPGTRGRRPCIVVVQLEIPGDPLVVGFLADTVSEVVQARERDFHHGKLHLGGRPRRVLDPACLLEARQDQPRGLSVG
jgi:chemotaxis signal transduction protein